MLIYANNLLSQGSTKKNSANSLVHVGYCEITKNFFYGKKLLFDHSVSKKFQGVIIKLTGKSGGSISKNWYPQQGVQYFFLKSPLCFYFILNLKEKIHPLETISNWSDLPFQIPQIWKKKLFKILNPTTNEWCLNNKLRLLQNLWRKCLFFVCVVFHTIVENDFYFGIFFFLRHFFLRHFFLHFFHLHQFFLSS